MGECILPVIAGGGSAPISANLLAGEPWRNGYYYWEKTADQQIYHFDSTYTWMCTENYIKLEQGKTYELFALNFRGTTEAGDFGNIPAPSTYSATFVNKTATGYDYDIRYGIVHRIENTYAVSRFTCDSDNLYIGVSVGEYGSYSFPVLVEVPDDTHVKPNYSFDCIPCTYRNI